MSDNSLEQLRNLYESGDISETAYRALLAGHELSASEIKAIIIQDSTITTGDKPVIASTAGRDIVTGDSTVTSEGDIITGIQINHIVNQYHSGNGVWGKKEYREALERYLKWVRKINGWVVMPGIQKGNKQAINLELADIYVPLAAEAMLKPKEELRRAMLKAKGSEPEGGHTKKIEMQQLLAQERNIVVIGSPGCGKTTVLQHIAWALSETMLSGKPEIATKRLGLSGELPLPVYVPLSLYASHRRKYAGHDDPRKCQLATFVNHYLLERQAGLNLPDDFFATLLNQGKHIILLLDGLDEVPNEDERVLVSQAVKDLVAGREQARFIVTSRSRAYEGRAVLGDDFGLVRVLPLSPEQVKRLIELAYYAIFPDDVEVDIRKQKAGDLTYGITQMEKERATRTGDGEENRLVSTPLLVRMLLIVHFNLRRLPDQRAELYMQVVDTLLSSTHNPDETVVQELGKLGGDWRIRRNMVQYLAYKMHSRGQEAGREISEPDLKRLLEEYLVERRKKSSEDAEQIVAIFVSVSRQRGGLLEEQGNKHRFSHLSFQEFLTARYLAEVKRDVGQIVKLIETEGYAADSWWREPILLTVGYLNITNEDTAIELIHQLAHLKDSALALHSAELAATAFLEWRDTDSFHQELAERLVELITNPDLPDVPPALRARAGAVLARPGLGDPRPGVGVDDKGLPDIVWCEVPGGEFFKGSDKNVDWYAFNNEPEQHTISLPTFSMSRYPVTNVQYEAFVADGGYSEERYWKEAKRTGHWKEGEIKRETYREGEMRTEWADTSIKFGQIFSLSNHPVVGINWYEAVAFCRWLTEKMQQVEKISYNEKIRLPNEIEWEKAARGIDGRIYPWGNETTPNKANYDDTSIGTTSAVGCFPDGVSPNGCLDMSGNVREMCSNIVGEEASHLEVQISRGGAFINDSSNIRCASYRNYDTDDFYDNLGFRCCKSVILQT